MDENEKLQERRKKVIPRGLAMVTPITAASAQGASLVDMEGNAFIDFASGIGVVTAGHCPEPVVQAIAEQAKKLIHACFMVTTYEPYVALAEELAELFPHGGPTKVLLTTTGAESVENAIKIARQATKRSAIICYTGAFHGRSMMAMALTSKVAYRVGCGPLPSDVYRLPFPDYYHHGDGLERDAFIERELNRLRDAFNTMTPAKEVAAIIIEPVQGEGGFNVAPIEYMRGLRRICDEHGILLIADEVQSGFCRTGAWSAYQHIKIIPDLSTWAKALGSGMPIGCVIGKAEIMDAAAPSTIGGTFPGNPVTCAAALATIQFMKDRDLNRRAREIGEIMFTRLRRLKARCPAVGDVRGLGAMVAMELVRDGDPLQPDAKLTKALLKACWKRRLLIIPAGVYKNVIRFLIPLTISDEILDQGLAIVEEELLELCGLMKS